MMDNLSNVELLNWFEDVIVDDKIGVAEDPGFRRRLALFEAVLARMVEPKKETTP